MKVIYCLGLVFAGCYFESAVRNASNLALYWANKQDLLQGLLPYLVPVFFGYLYAFDVRSHWSENRLKNDVMAYVGSTLLIGYPLYVSLSFWLAGSGLDATSMRVRLAATLLLAGNLVVAFLTWRAALIQGHPFTMPWGDRRKGNGVESEREVESEKEDGDSEETGDAGDEETAAVEADAAAEGYSSDVGADEEDAGDPDDDREVIEENPPKQ